MGIKETVLGWLRTTPDKDKDLEAAAIDEANREYSAEKADAKANSLRWSSPDEFESDQHAPR
ncbi:MAG: hypothetical protein ABWY51_02995 [Gaiellaceae bacterium]